MKTAIILAVSLFSLSVMAQGEANNWYFGNNAGITFNTNPPSALIDGELDTVEGCSSISDPNGNLLMYTDGRTVWNRNHEIMPNADYFGGTGLNGDPSSTSSGLIVPNPTQPGIYYVFTVDEPHHDNANAYPDQGPADSNGNPIPFYTDVSTHSVPEDDDGFNNGLNYSIVDMSLNNGLGDVVTGERNNELITYDPNDPEEIKYKASEKITAVRGRDCNSVWVITHFKTNFYAFFIDDNGVDETPVISNAPPLLDISNYRRAALGYLKASPNGDKLLIAHNTTNYNPSDGNVDAGDGNVYAYDFDNLTGQVSNPVELINQVNSYGVEFSQDGTKAYATVSDTSARILQWDLSSNDIPNSVHTVSTGNANTALQLGPDGKIYHSLINTSRLGVINNPNAIGNDVNYTQNLAQGAISLGGREAVFGLPPFIQSLFSERIQIVDSQDLSTDVIEQVVLCDVFDYTLSYDEIPGATYVWSKNGEVIPGATDYFLDISEEADASGLTVIENYSLEVDLNQGECPLTGVAQITFNQSPEYEDLELLTCRDSSNDTAVYDLNEIDLELVESYDVSQNEILVRFYENETDAINEENPLLNTFSFANDKELEFIYANIETYNSCEDIITIGLKVEEFPGLDEEEERITLCEENPNGIELDAGDGNTGATLNYLWSNGETSPVITVNSEGSYSVEVNIQDSDCFQLKNFIVTSSNIATFDHRIERLNHQNTLELLVDSSSLGDYEFAIDVPENFQEDPIFDNLNTGIYEVFVRDKLGCGISKKTIGVLGIMEFFTPNGDGINDEWQISGLLENSQENLYIQVYDRYGKLLTAFTNQDPGWDGTYNGKRMPTDDYWYRIRLTDGTVETGSFTLKR